MQRYQYVMRPGAAVELPDTEAIRPNQMIAHVCRTIAPDDGREHLIAVALDARGNTIGVGLIASGTVDACMLYPRDIFTWALQVPTARYVGIAHNHPSGVVEPSEPDIKGTAVVAGASKLLGLDLLWHIVFTHRSDAWQEVPLKTPKMEGEDAQPRRPETPEPDEDEPEDGKAPGDPEDGGEPGDSGPEDGEDGAAAGKGQPGAPPPNVTPEVSLDDVRAAMRRLLGR